jgi:hypothetical protein
MLGHPVDRPLLERDDQGVLGQFLGQPDIPDQPGQAGDDAGRLHPPDRFHHTARIGSRHGYRSSHLGSVAPRPSTGRY